MTKKEVEKICNRFHIKNWTLNSDGTVDVYGGVSLHNRGLNKLPLRFGNVSGYFYCSSNILTTLEGGPTHVGGKFDCSSNKLTSLVGCPSRVGGNFYCGGNKIFDFEGFPKHIGEEVPSSIESPLIGNPVNEVWKLFGNKDDVEFFNDCDPIRGNSIVLDRLNFFLEETGRPTVTRVKGYKII